MREKENLIFDWFRLICAFLVVAIHTGPFSGIHEELDYYLTYCIGRIGVPFFLMMTGYYVLGESGRTDAARIGRATAKILVLYVFATALYLPLGYYAGNLPHAAGGALRWFAFDGTFYHLWYLPASILGVWLVWFLLRYAGVRAGGIIVFLLYLIGVFGDSWYGLAVQGRVSAAFYDMIFVVSSQTRNGIFLAPVFLWMGAWQRKRRLSWRTACVWICFGFSLAGMLAEGTFTRAHGFQRYNTMYVCLMPVMFFLLEGLKRLRSRGAACMGRTLRKTAMWIYLLHPLVIVAVRAAAGIFGKKEWVTAYPFENYLVVCVLSFAAGCCLAAAGNRERAAGGSGKCRIK